MKARGDTESAHQSAYFQWVRIKCNSDQRFLNIFAIPNGGKRTKGTAGRMKAEGVVRGVLDVFCAIPNDAWAAHGLFIEFKRGKNKLTGEQQAFLSRVRAAGYACVVCYSVDEAIAMTERYLDDAKRA